MNEKEEVATPQESKKSLIRMVADFKDARVRREQKLNKNIQKNPA